MAKKESATKRNLLNISRRLMMSKGYNATTIEEICTLGEVTKGAFFYYFKSKEDLGVKVLQDYWADRNRQFAESDWMEAETPLEQITQFLEVVAGVFMNDPDGYSCLAGSFTQELAETNPIFRTLVAELFAEWAMQIKPILQAAKIQASSPKQIDVDVLADYMVAVVEGALILAVARQDPNVIGSHLQLLNAHLRVVYST